MANISTQCDRNKNTLEGSNEFAGWCRQRVSPTVEGIFHTRTKRRSFPQQLAIISNSKPANQQFSSSSSFLLSRTLLADRRGGSVQHRTPLQFVSVSAFRTVSIAVPFEVQLLKLPIAPHRHLSTDNIPVGLDAFESSRVT